MEKQNVAYITHEDTTTTPSFLLSDKLDSIMERSINITSIISISLGTYLICKIVLAIW